MAILLTLVIFFGIIGTIIINRQFQNSSKGEIRVPVRSDDSQFFHRDK